MSLCARTIGTDSVFTLPASNSSQVYSKPQRFHEGSQIFKEAWSQFMPLMMQALHMPRAEFQGPSEKELDHCTRIQGALILLYSLRPHVACEKHFTQLVSSDAAAEPASRCGQQYQRENPCSHKLAVARALNQIQTSLRKKRLLCAHRLDLMTLSQSAVHIPTRPSLRRLANKLQCLT